MATPQEELDAEFLRASTATPLPLPPDTAPAATPSSTPAPRGVGEQDRLRGAVNRLDRTVQALPGQIAAAVATAIQPANVTAPASRPPAAPTAPAAVVPPQAPASGSTASSTTATATPAAQPAGATSNSTAQQMTNDWTWVFFLGSVLVILSGALFIVW